MTIAQKFYQSICGKNKKKKRAFFNSLGLSVFVVLMMVYLWQVNTGVNRCLEIEKTKKQVEVLKRQNQELMKETSSISSVANIYELVQELKMIKTEKPDYLVFSQNNLAKK